jgi:hypothetical protein
LKRHLDILSWQKAVILRTVPWKYFKMVYGELRPKSTS